MDFFKLRETIKFYIVYQYKITRNKNRISEQEISLKLGTMANETKTNMTMEKQLNINQLPVPFYLHEMIKEFVFHDRVLYEAKMQVKEHMKLTLYAIKHSHYYFMPNFPDWNLNTWSTWCMMTRGVQLGGLSCRKCGDFIRQIQNQYSDRVICNCEVQRDTVEDQGTLYGGNR
jgi:hypothetical protein